MPWYILQDMGTLFMAAIYWTLENRSKWQVFYAGTSKDIPTTAQNLKTSLSELWNQVLKGLLEHGLDHTLERSSEPGSPLFCSFSIYVLNFIVSYPNKGSIIY